MPVWAWVLFVVLAAGIGLLAVRVARRAREDPFADVPRDEAPSVLAARDDTAHAPDVAEVPADTIGAPATRRPSLEERLRAAAAARVAKAPEAVEAAEPAADRPDRSVAPPERRGEAAPRPAFEVRSLDPSRRAEHERRWRELGEALVATPAEAIADADAFVRELMAERGLPVDAGDETLTEAAIAHPDVMDPYRLATAIARDAERGRATPSDLSRARIHYRDVVTRLLADEQARPS